MAPDNRTSTHNVARNTIEVSEQLGVRYLHFGSDWVQGAMRLREPEALELEYTRAMMAMLLLNPEPKEILLIGLGAGSLTKFLYRHLPAAALTVVELDERVVDIARLHFQLPLDARRIRIEINDGSVHIATTAKRYDLILVDGFDARARAGPLDTAAFYLNCRRALAPDGLLATNLFGRIPRYNASVRRISAAFESRVLTLPPCAAGNVIAIAGRGSRRVLTVAQLTERAGELKLATGLDLSKLVGRIAKELADFRSTLVL
jgi:spermidine synthase